MANATTNEHLQPAYITPTDWDGTARLDNPPGGILPLVWRRFLADHLAVWRAGAAARPAASTRSWGYLHGPAGTGKTRFLNAFWKVSGGYLIVHDEYDRLHEGLEGVDRPAGHDTLVLSGTTRWDDLTAQQRRGTYRVEVYRPFTEEELDPETLLQHLAELEQQRTVAIPDELEHQRRAEVRQQRCAADGLDVPHLTRDTARWIHGFLNPDDRTER